MSKNNTINISSNVLFFTIMLLCLIGCKSNIDSSCGCDIPVIELSPMRDSWDDIKDNWVYKECVIADGSVMNVVQKIHIYQGKRI